MIKAILFLMVAGLCVGQEQPVAQQRFYKFDFVVKELDGGKVLSAKSYSSMGRANTKPQDTLMIRSGDKVPVTNAKGEPTFMDVGTNIDCRVLAETSGELTLYISLDLSGADTQHPPVISQTRWNSNIVVPLKKPTVVFSSESATKKVTTQLEVTVTPLQ